MDLLMVAIENVKKAVELDNDNRYEEALSQYEIAIEHLLNAAKSKQISQYSSHYSSKLHHQLKR